MKHWKPVVLILLVLLLASSACKPAAPIGDTATPETVAHGTNAPGDQALLETKVAATLTALAPVLPPRGEAPTQAAPEATRVADPTAVVVTPTEASPAVMVAYAKDGVVYLWSPGTSRPLSSPGSAVYTVLLSDDGRRVAYTRQVDDLRQEIWVVPTDGMDGTLVMSSADFAAIDPEALAVLPNQIGWVPGSHILAFNTHQVFDGPGISPYDDLHLIDADSFERRTPFLAGEGGDFYFSPDGAQVAFSTPTRVDLVNLDGSNRRSAALSFEMVLTFSEYMLYPLLVWAADSSSVWAAIPPHDAMAVPAQPTAVWSIPADGSPAVKSSEFNVAPLLGFELPISPDTQRVAYLAEIGAAPDTQLELHLRSLDGSTDEPAQAAPFMDFLSWSPDGRHYAVNVGNEQALYLGAVDGSFAPAPGAPLGVNSLEWLDGKQYVYVQTGANGSSLIFGSTQAAPQVIDSVGEGVIAFSVP